MHDAGSGGLDEVRSRASKITKACDPRERTIDSCPIANTRAPTEQAVEALLAMVLLLDI